MPRKLLRGEAAAPECVDLDGLEDFDHLVFRVEHPIIIFCEDGGGFYTHQEARQCVRWLQVFAPESPYAGMNIYKSDDLWRLETVAWEIKVPRSTVRSAVLAGSLPAVRLADGGLLVSLRDARAWDARRRAAAGGTR